MNECDSLREYVECQSEQAFTELVSRHVNLVYSAAVRIVGEPELAQDVSQAVFIQLARKARSLRDSAALSGWLYRVTCHTASNMVRTEQRRRQREAEAVNRAELESNTPDAWRAMAPLLDEAMQHLNQAEQDALVLRFFEGKTLREVGQSLAVSEDAVQKRVSRALEKLRAHFAQRGVAVSAVVIASALATHAVQAAPAGLAAALAGTSLAGAASAAAGTFTALLRILIMNKLQATTVGLLFVAGVATPLLTNSSTGVPMRNEFNAQSGFNAQSAQPAAAALPDEKIGARLQGSAALSRLEAWLLRMDRTNLQGFRDEELRAMIWSLAAADYPQAWRLAEKIRSEKLRNLFQADMVHYWSKLDPRAALTAAETLGGRARREAVDQVLTTWAEKEPTAALAWIRESLPENRRAFRLASAIQAMARTDPQGAVAALEELPSGLTRERATLGLTRQWAEQDPATAFSFISKMPFSSQKYGLLFSLAETWALKDPQAESQWVQTLTDRRERASVLIPSIRGLVDKAGFAEAAELLKRFQGDFVDNPGEIGNRCLTPIMSDWVGSDLSAAKNWVMQLPEGGFRDEALQSLLTHWSHEAPGEAAAFAAALPEGRIQRQGIKDALAQWCAEDAQSAIDWAAGLPLGSARDAAITGVCERMALLRPMDAADLVASLPPGDMQTQTAIEVAKRWVNSDPQSAAAWVALFPEGQAREQAAKAVINAWAWKDAPAAASWLASLPASPAREQAAQAYVSAVAAKQPDLAAAWVSAFTDPTERDKQIETIARKWLATDPEAARKWLQQTALPEQRKRLLISQ
jgi:RNA polymerase sigma factor (sigma-70 family)